MKLYACTTSVAWELVPENAGSLAFYCSPEALKKDQSCWESCGISEVEISAGKSIIAPKPTPPISAKELEERELVSIPASNQVVDFVESLTDNKELRKEILLRALAVIKSL
jgi:hypothetical protein